MGKKKKKQTQTYKEAAVLNTLFYGTAVYSVLALTCKLKYKNETQLRGAWRLKCLNIISSFSYKLFLQAVTNSF